MSVRRFVVAWLVISIACASCASHSTNDATAPPDAGDARAISEASSVDGAVVDVAKSDASTFDGPRTLAETGLYSDLEAGTLADGVIPYEVRYELWADGASKSRYLWLPPGTKIDTADMDNWVFPIGTKVWKEFRVAGRRIETRFLHKRGEGDGGWIMIAYAWSADGTHADAVPDGVVGALGTTHDIPDTLACTSCHGGVRDALNGVSAFQLSAADGHGALSRLSADGRLSSPPASEFQVPGTGTVQAALGYLHANCGHCHNDTSFLAKTHALRLRLRVADVTPESTTIYTTAIDAPMAHTWDGGPNVAVAPGSPEGSQLFYRMGRRDGYGMPPVGSRIVDDAALVTIRAWISGLPH